MAIRAHSGCSCPPASGAQVAAPWLGGDAGKLLLWLMLAKCDIIPDVSNGGNSIAPQSFGVCRPHLYLRLDEIVDYLFKKAMTGLFLACKFWMYFSEQYICIDTCNIQHVVKHHHGPPLTYACRDVQTAHLIYRVNAGLSGIVVADYIWFLGGYVYGIIMMHSRQENDIPMFFGYIRHHGRHPRKHEL